MKKAFFLLLAVLAFIGAKANDGVYYASGNQLIPINETDISVKKEVLTITRVGDHVEVTVYYEFFNPGKPKDLLVGFEAPAPYPAYEEDMSLFPNQPHIRNFKVVFNGDKLPFEIAHVEDSYREDWDTKTPRKYYVNGKIKSMTRQQCVDAMSGEYADVYSYYFVYHFNAHFREGLNIIQHTYEADLSSSVEEEYSFDYILTAANRWANNGIDDFTLEINMGERESFMVQSTFFKNANEWTINGKGKMTMETEWGPAGESGSPYFHIQDGSIVYKKKNFHPEGELNISKHLWQLLFFSNWEESNDGQAELEMMKRQYNNLSVAYFEDSDTSKFTAEEKRILKNLPFAYRGHIFKDAGLKKYFESTRWYLPDPAYKDSMESLTPAEKKWVQFWSK
jgi:hypothetical protein